MYRFFLLGWLLVFCHVCHGTALASSLNLDVKDSLMDLKAEDVPLADILKAISEKAGLSINVSDDTMMEPISCEFKGISVEKVIQQLLKDKNYAIFYAETGNHQLLPVEVWIVSGNNFQSSLMPSPPGNPLITAPAYNHSKEYSKEWFKKEFEDEDRLFKLISASATKEHPDGRGITITSVSKDSLFQEIGLQAGDIIYNVNGMTIYTLEDFLLVLKSVSWKEQSNLTIGLRSLDNSTHPIYISLH